MIKAAFFTFMMTLAGGALALAPPLPLGEQFQVNTYTTSEQWHPAVAADADGNFVLVWESAGSDTDTDHTSILGQLYAADGSAIGGEFQVNTYTTGYQDYPAVGMASDGAFVVVWESGGQFGAPGPDGDGSGIAGRRYGSDGSAIGAEFQVNSHTPSRQTRPAVAMRANGGFVAVWESNGSTHTDFSQKSVQGQLYASDGSTVDGQFQVNTYTTLDQEWPAVAVDAEGDFVVLWESQGSDDPDTYECIQAQRYASDATPVGGEFQVNSYTGLSSQQLRPDVAAAPDGHFLAVWHSDASTGTDQDSYSIQGQLYASNGTRVGGEFQVNSITNGGQTVPSAASASTGFLVVWQSSWAIEGQLYDSDAAPIGDEFQVSSYTASFHLGPSVAADAGGRGVAGWSSDVSSGSDSSWLSIQGQRLIIPVFVDGFESGDTSAWSATAGGP